MLIIFPLAKLYPSAFVVGTALLEIARPVWLTGVCETPSTVKAEVINCPPDVPSAIATITLIVEPV